MEHAYGGYRTSRVDFAATCTRSFEMKKCSTSRNFLVLIGDFFGWNSNSIWIRWRTSERGSSNMIQTSSKGIPGSIHGATTQSGFQSGFRGTDARTKPSHGLGLNHPTDYHPTDISQWSQDRNTTSARPGPG